MDSQEARREIGVRHIWIARPKIWERQELTDHSWTTLNKYVILVLFDSGSSFTNIKSGAISSMPTQSATSYMMTPEMAGFEAGSNMDSFSGGSMAFPGAVVGMNDIFDAPLLYQLSHPLHDQNEPLV
jgi:hypothetical protein